MREVGEIAGWISVAVGQLVSWPQVVRLRCDSGQSVSLMSYGLVLVSTSLFFLHAMAIGDTVAQVSVPLSLVPNVLIAATLARRRRSGAVPRAIANGSCQQKEGGRDG